MLPSAVFRKWREMTGSACFLVKMPWQSAAGLISKLYKRVRALLLLVSKIVFDPGFGFQRVEACFREMLVLKKKKKRTQILLLEAAVRQQGLTETAVMYPRARKGSSRGEVDIYFFLTAWSQEGTEQGRQRKELGVCGMCFLMSVFACVDVRERHGATSPLL